jgi:ATP-dependent DNA helicase RecG
MVEFNMIDTQGGGIKRNVATQRERSFPSLITNISGPDSVSVAISGTILDERYSRLLLEKTDLDLNKVILLDRVQKSLVIPKEDARMLRAEGLVEGRYPKLMVAARLARAVGKPGQHIRDRGLDRRYYWI